MAIDVTAGSHTQNIGSGNLNRTIFSMFMTISNVNYIIYPVPYT